MSAAQRIIETLESTSRPEAPELDLLIEVLQPHYPQITRLDRLAGEADVNYRATTSDGPLMVKLSRIDAEGFCHAPGRLLDQLLTVDPTLPVPRTVCDALGAPEVVVDLPSEPLAVTVTSWVQGRASRDVPSSADYLRAVGATLGRLDCALGLVSLELPDRPTPWDLVANAEAVGDMVRTLPDADKDHLTEELAQFVKETVPALARLRPQIIHNDLNQDNVVAHLRQDRPIGVLDFGDAIVSPAVVDVGTAAAYFVDTSSVEGLIASFGSFVRGYREHVSLDQESIGLVSRVMRARWAFALAINTARAAASADDLAHIAYVTRNSEAARRCLALAREVSHEALMNAAA